MSCQLSASDLPLPCRACLSGPLVSTAEPGSKGRARYTISIYIVYIVCVYTHVLPVSTTRPLCIPCMHALFSPIHLLHLPLLFLLLLLTLLLFRSCASPSSVLLVAARLQRPQLHLFLRLCVHSMYFVSCVYLHISIYIHVYTAGIYATTARS